MLLEKRLEGTRLLAMATTLQTLGELNAIKELVVKYHHDWSLDPERVSAAFAPNPNIMYLGDQLAGVEALLERAKASRGLATCYRYVGNHTANVTGSTAKAETLVLEYLRRGQVDTVSTIQYSDELTKVNGHWLFRSQVVVTKWARTDPVTS